MIQPSLDTRRIHIPAIDMQYLGSLIYTKNSEFGGLMTIVREDDGRYVARVDDDSVAKGHETHFSVVLPPYRRGCQISFHTHPNICYKKLGCVLGAPSIGDYIVSFERLLRGEAVHLVCSLEGVYAMRLHETALNLLRQLARTSSLFPSLEDGLGIMVRAMGICIENLMRPLENGRFIVPKLTQSIKQEGANAHARFVNTATGAVYSNANVALRNISSATRTQIRDYGKGLYKNTVAHVNTLTLGNFLDQVSLLMQSNAQRQVFETIVRRRYGSWLDRAMSESVFHVRLYHRSMPGEEKSVSIFSDYSKSIDMTVLVDTSRIKKTPVKTMNEEFTARPTPPAFLKGDTSPYSSSRQSKRRKQ